MTQSPQRYKRSLESHLDRPIAEKGEVRAVYKPRGRKELKMQTQEAVIKTEKQKLDHDWCQGEEITETYVGVEELFLEVLSSFELMCDRHQAGLLSQNIE